MGFTEKIRFLGEGGGRGSQKTKNQYIGRDYLERRAWTVCRFNRGLGEKEESGVCKGLGG